MKHFLFLTRFGQRLPVAGPYDSDEDLEADLSRIEGLLDKRDPWTGFDMRVRGKTSDVKLIEVFTAHVNRVFPVGNEHHVHPFKDGRGRQVLLARSRRWDRCFKVWLNSGNVDYADDYIDEVVEDRHAINEGEQ